jgi:hypothetical protein
VVFALSVHTFVDKIGAYVGFAAAIGLALFALLLFAQARELKRLREWGAQAHDRIGELERRVAAALELARRASAPQRTMAPGAGPAAAAQRPRTGAPAQRAAGARAGAPVIARTSSPTRLPLLPAAPVGVAGAALGSATMFVPLPKHPPGAVPAGGPAPAPAPLTRPPAAGRAPVAPTVPPAAPATAPATIPAPAAAAAASTPMPAPARPAPAPATAAAQGPAQPAPTTPTPAPSAPPAPPAPAGENGHSDTFPPLPPVRRPLPPTRGPAGRRPPARPAARPGQRPVPAAPLRARGPATATPRGGGNGSGVTEAPHGRRRLTLLLAGLGVVALAAIAVIVLLGGGSDSPSQAPAGSSSPPAQQTTGASGGTSSAPAPAHDKITVAVLNGTTTAGLASTIASQLTADGFVKGAVTNASDQGRSVTVVSYFGGHEREAQEVAKTLDVPSDAVQPIDADTEAACAQGATCTASVVVTVGADRQ